MQILESVYRNFQVCDRHSQVLDAVEIALQVRGLLVHKYEC